MNRLIASASTVEGVLKLLSEYFQCSVTELQINNRNVIKNGKHIQHLQVRKKQQRFRIEIVDVPNQTR